MRVSKTSGHATVHAGVSSRCQSSHSGNSHLQAQVVAILHTLGTLTFKLYMCSTLCVACARAKAFVALSSAGFCKFSPSMNPQPYLWADPHNHHELLFCSERSFMLCILFPTLLSILFSTPHSRQPAVSVQVCQPAGPAWKRSQICRCH